MNTETAGHDHIRLIVKRQEGPNAKPHWEEFSVAHQPHMNVVSALMEIRKNPVNAQGKPTTPVVWESVCLEEVCGACTMIINGKPVRLLSTI
jgi:succinate dehydrogenase / fumarate reductase iron-sulfur subunit